MFTASQVPAFAAGRPVERIVGVGDRLGATGRDVGSRPGAYLTTMSFVRTSVFGNETTQK